MARVGFDVEAAFEEQQNRSADALRRLAELGGRVLEPPETIVPGVRARVRYPDGSVAKLVGQPGPAYALLPIAPGQTAPDLTRAGHPDQFLSAAGHAA